MDKRDRHQEIITEVNAYISVTVSFRKAFRAAFCPFCHAHVIRAYMPYHCIKQSPITIKSCKNKKLKNVAVKENKRTVFYLKKKKFVEYWDLGVNCRRREGKKTAVANEKLRAQSSISLNIILRGSVAGVFFYCPNASALTVRVELYR